MRLECCAPDASGSSGAWHWLCARAGRPSGNRSTIEEGATRAPRAPHQSKILGFMRCYWLLPTGYCYCHCLWWIAYWLRATRYVLLPTDYWSLAVGCWLLWLRANGLCQTLLAAGDWVVPTVVKRLFSVLPPWRQKQKKERGGDKGACRELLMTHQPVANSQ